MRGLVLEGGGVLGAYEFGCLQVFHEQGIEFEAVAGTSVGALNAAIWSTGRLSEGEELWRNISQTAIFPEKLPKILGAPALWFIVLANAYVTIGVQGASPEGAKRGSLLALVNSLWLSLLIFAYIIGSPQKIHDPGLVVIALIVAGCLFALLERAAFNFPYIFFLFSLLGYVEVVSIVLSPIIRRLTSTDVATALSPKDVGAAFAGVMLLPLLCLPSLLSLITYTVTRWNVSVWDSEPLRRKILKIVEAGFRKPTIVTTAYKKEFYDPDRLIYDDLGEAGVQIPIPRAVTSFIPTYRFLQELSVEDGVDALLASAAIPLGFVPAVWVCNEKCVDGGMADNLPIYPMISLLRCDELVVVRIEPSRRGTNENEEYLQRWTRIDRLRRVIEDQSDVFGVPEKYRMKEDDPYPSNVDNNPPTIVPYRSPENWPERIVTISPTEPLGCPLSRINFSSGFARHLIERGRRDASEAIRKHNLKREG